MPSKQANTLRLPPPEVLESLSEKQRELIVEAAVLSASVAPPSIYRSYEAILPGSAERILRWVQQEQQHRLKIESEALKRSYWRQGLATDDMTPTVDRDGRCAKRPSETRPLG